MIFLIFPIIHIIAARHRILACQPHDIAIDCVQYYKSLRRLTIIVIEEPHIIIFRRIVTFHISFTHIRNYV